MACYVSRLGARLSVVCFLDDFFAAAVPVVGSIESLNLIFERLVFLSEFCELFRMTEHGSSHLLLVFVTGVCFFEWTFGGAAFSPGVLKELVIVGGVSLEDVPLLVEGVESIGDVMTVFELGFAVGRLIHFELVML